MKMKTLMALMALTTLTACDYAVRNDLRSERDDRIYREAMDDYRAGRMEAAVVGFEKAVRNDPSNASARFQLACLHQDLKKDFLSAYCGYREYLLQHPESDRAKLACDRLAVCEKEVARALSHKFGLDDAESQERVLSALRAELQSYKDRLVAAERNLGVSQERVRALSAEREKLLAVVKGVGAEDADEAETAGEQMSIVLKERDLLDEEDEDSREPSLIPVPGPEDLDDDLPAPFKVQAESRDAAVKPSEPAKNPGESPSQKASDRPKTYVVQDGDTLYGVSKRFYGSIQHWKQIREANKALISSDNRLRVGDTLVLP